MNIHYLSNDVVKVCIIYLFIQEILSTYYVPGKFLSPGTETVNNIVNAPDPRDLTFQWGTQTIDKEREKDNIIL